MPYINLTANPLELQEEKQNTCSPWKYRFRASEVIAIVEINIHLEFGPHLKIPNNPFYFSLLLFIE